MARKRRPLRDRLLEWLNGHHQGEIIEVGPYQWRLREASRMGVSGEWERVDEPHYSKTGPNLVDTIIELKVKPKDVSDSARKRSRTRRKNAARPPIDRAIATLEGALGMNRKAHERAGRRITDAQERQAELDREHEELKAALESLKLRREAH